MDIMKKIIIYILLFISASSTVCHSDEEEIIAVIKSRNIIQYNTALRGFKNYLIRAGIDARVIEYNIEGKREDGLMKIFEEIELSKPSLVLTLGTSATKIAKEMIKDVPVVFTMVLNPEGSKISPPGVVMDIHPEIELKNLRRILPDAKVIGLIYSNNSISTYKEISQVSGQFSFQLIGKKINSGNEFSKALDDIFWQTDCFLMTPDSKIYFPKSVEYLLQEGLRKKIPVVGFSSHCTQAGAIISFECDYEDLGRQTAEYVLRMLAGEELVNLKFIKPRKIIFSLNLIVAQRLGVKVPSEVIKKAYMVFGE